MTIFLAFLMGMIPFLAHGSEEDQTIPSLAMPRSMQCFGTFDYVGTHENHGVRYNLNEFAPEQDPYLYEGLGIEFLDTPSNPEDLCFDYAFQIFLNDPSLRCLRPSKNCLGFDDIINDALCCYCDRIFVPQQGDLAVYDDPKNTRNSDAHHNTRPLHFGLYQQDGSMISKWGTESIYRHPPFCVPMMYGVRIRYYRLKPTFSEEDRLSFIRYLTHAHDS